MKISEDLSAFLENKYERLLQNEQREEKDRKTHKQNKEARKKRLNRWVRNELNVLTSAKQKGWISDSNYQIEKNELIRKVEKKKSDYRKKDKEYIRPYGKTQYDRNSFICLFWYLMKKETNELNASIIYRVIIDFLTKKKFKKNNDKNYNENDIKRIIYEFETAGDARSDIESYFDFMYSEFKQK